MRILSVTETHPSILDRLECTELTVSMNLLELLTLAANYGCSSTQDSYESIQQLLEGVGNTADLRGEIARVDPFDLEHKVSYQIIRTLLVEKLREVGVS